MALYLFLVKTSKLVYWTLVQYGRETKGPLSKPRTLRLPRSVSGRSVIPVCWPERLQAVSPNPVSESLPVVYLAATMKSLAHYSQKSVQHIASDHFAPAETRCPRIIASGSRKLSKI